ncbi:MAG: hypothetical protein K1X88_14310 [Nannocystaceae bacterium]|nr:hypothetical protein [Nannocystaceae bacterium]
MACTRPAVLVASLLPACTVETRGDPAGSASVSVSSTVAGDSGDSAGSSSGGSEGSTAGSADGSGDTDKLDLGAMAGGCAYIDLLFVIDNSQSMQTYQQALADNFPAFVDAMFAAIPPGIGIHVGITTTDFDDACGAAEATANCQSTATVDEVLMHYRTPDMGDDGGNGTQGKLFEFGGKRYFEIGSDDDPAPLAQWFADAATAAGEDGCSFEMPVAASGFVAAPDNGATNDGFLRDEGALLVVFFLTDEPDKSPESKDLYAQMLIDAKAGCGGADCIFVSGLVPSCITDVNQKLWQFMKIFADTPFYGDIGDVAHYDDLVGTVLADAVAQACANIPVG